MGYHGYARANSESSVNQFIETLKHLGAEFNKQQPGYYNFYQIGETGEMIYDIKTSGYYFAKPLIFQYTGEESKLNELVLTDGKELYKDDIYISVFTYKGGHFYNWGK